MKETAAQNAVKTTNWLQMEDVHLKIVMIGLMKYAWYVEKDLKSKAMDVLK